MVVCAGQARQRDQAAHGSSRFSFTPPLTERQLFVPSASYCTSLNGMHAPAADFAVRPVDAFWYQLRLLLISVDGSIFLGNLSWCDCWLQGVVTLAVGDGGNDAVMIKQANVGMLRLSTATTCNPIQRYHEAPYSVFASASLWRVVRFCCDPSCPALWSCGAWPLHIARCAIGLGVRYFALCSWLFQGVGITGEEGSAASRAADFSIGKVGHKCRTNCLWAGLRCILCPCLCFQGGACACWFCLAVLPCLLHASR